MYDAQVTQVDALIGQLVSAIDRLGLEDETILVITSDHGDLLGELGLFSHKLLLHDALINVPVVVRGSEALAGTDLGLAQHADIMQTILAELGVPTDGMQGIRLDQAEREMAVAQRGGETCEKTLTAVRERTPSFENEHVLPGFVTALRTEEWKFVSGADESALYRLPVETEDIKAEHPAVAARFSERLDEWLDSYGQPAESDSTAEFDDQVKRRLADLGYVE